MRHFSTQRATNVQIIVDFPDSIGALRDLKECLAQVLTGSARLAARMASPVARRTGVCRKRAS
jgi:hypothetical protein